MNTLQTITWAVGTITAIGGGALTLESRYTPSQDFARHVAESRGSTVLTLVDQARREPEGPFRDSLCRALIQELNAICSDSPTHALCQDRLAYLDRAGCD